MSELLLLKALELTLCGLNGDGEITLCIELAVYLCLGALAQEVSLCLCIVVVFGESAFAEGIDLVCTHLGINLGRSVCCLVHRNDSTTLHQHGQLPQGCREVVDDTTTMIYIAGEVVNPLALGQIDAIANIVTFLVGTSCLIDGSNQDVGTEHILILGALAKSEGILLLEEHGTNHRQTINSLASDSILIGKNL